MAAFGYCGEVRSMVWARAERGYRGVSSRRWRGVSHHRALAIATLADQVFAADFQAVQIAQNRQR